MACSCYLSYSTGKVSGLITGSPRCASCTQFFSAFPSFFWDIFFSTALIKIYVVRLSSSTVNDKLYTWWHFTCLPPYTQKWLGKLSVRKNMKIFFQFLYLLQLTNFEHIFLTSNLRPVGLSSVMVFILKLPRSSTRTLPLLENQDNSMKNNHHKHTPPPTHIHTKEFEKLLIHTNLSKRKN